MTLISNARMYAVCPEAEAAWRALLARISDDAGIPLSYQEYPAPQPLEQLWRRPDIGCVQMCGYPIALGVADVAPIAAPVPRASWAQGKAVYRSDLIVRRDAEFGLLPDTFAGTVGWTVEHSHSGFNALRHHLLPYRSDARPHVYQHAVGKLITARKVLDSVLDGTIDIGPLDAYWHMLIDKFKPDMTAGVRVLESTAVAPMPAFVAGTNVNPETVQRLRSAFSQAHARPWFAELGEALLIDGFTAVTLDTYQPTMDWNLAAQAAGYLEPV